MVFTPTGLVKTQLPGGNGGVTWEDVTQYDKFIERECALVDWPVERVRGHILMESRGNPSAVQNNLTNGASYGLLQVVPFGVGWKGWHELVIEKAGLPKNASTKKIIDALYDPAINIACGVAILESFYVKHGSLDKASSAFFTGRSDWGAGDTVNGTTGKQYQAALNGLIAEQKAQAAKGDPIAVIMGRTQYSDDYGFKSPTTLPYYAYFQGHGGNANQHTGIDVPGSLGDTLYTPLAGIVTCSGTGIGLGSWNTGCAAFPAPDSGGVGRVEIMTDAGISLILGHCQKALVRAGERVQAGQAVATIGSMNGSHVHIETRIWQNGDYLITDPRETLIKAMGGEVPVTYPLPNPVPQPSEFDVSVEVTVTADTLPVLQRADLNATPTKPPLRKGDTFRAVYQALGNDLRIYWITTLANRVPVEGTSAPDWKGGSSVISDGGISQETLDLLVDTLDKITINHDRGSKDTSEALRATITALGNLKGVA